MLIVEWDYTPPPNVSLYEHIMFISIAFSRLAKRDGRPGVFVVSPEVAAMLETHHGLRAVPFVAGEPPVKLGNFCGFLEVYVDPTVLPEIVSYYDELHGQELGRVRIKNLVDEETILDHLARI